MLHHLNKYKAICHCHVRVDFLCLPSPTLSSSFPLQRRRPSTPGFLRPAQTQEVLLVIVLTPAEARWPLPLFGWRKCFRSTDTCLDVCTLSKHEVAQISHCQTIQNSGFANHQAGQDFMHQSKCIAVITVRFLLTKVVLLIFLDAKHQATASLYSDVAPSLLSISKIAAKCRRWKQMAQLYFKSESKRTCRESSADLCESWEVHLILIKTNKSKPLVPYDERKHYKTPKKSLNLENKPVLCQKIHLKKKNTFNKWNFSEICLRRKPRGAPAEGSRVSTTAQTSCTLSSGCFNIPTSSALFLLQPLK